MYTSKHPAIAKGGRRGEMKEIQLFFFTWVWVVVTVNAEWLLSEKKIHSFCPCCLGCNIIYRSKHAENFRLLEILVIGAASAGLNKLRPILLYYSLPHSIYFFHVQNLCFPATKMSKVIIKKNATYPFDKTATFHSLGYHDEFINK